ncbi:MAG: metalloregulator ArsR/SmtB family transcription factor [Mariprofundales bacterium]
MMQLHETTALCRLLSESNRLRLLVLLEQEELSVQELAHITGMPQPRVSSHLARLRQSGLVIQRKSGTLRWQRFFEEGLPIEIRQLWQHLRKNIDDALLHDDAERLQQTLVQRQGDNWAERVAGDMERHYSPGRTWETTAQAMLGLLSVGNVLDIASGDGVIAEAIAPRAVSVVCVDINAKVVDAGQRRGLKGVNFVQGDMHRLPFAANSFNQVLMLMALSYTITAEAVVREAIRVAKPGASIVLTALKRHAHVRSVAAYNHLNHGFEVGQLNRLLREQRLHISQCQVTTKERKAPYFEIITVCASK